MGGYNKENIGRFEAMQTAKNALTGHKDLIDIRAQQLGSPVGAIDRVEAFSTRQSMVRDEALAVRDRIENQLSMVEQQKLLKAIVAKQRSLGVETKSLNQQAEIQQPQVELQQLAQEIPTAIAMGPTALLIAWILKKLPDRVYKITAAMTILSMALSACSAMNNREIEIGQVGSATATASLPNTESNNNAGVEVTPSATATETAPEVYSVESLYDQYFAGEKIDVSKLSEDEWVELSIKLAEKKNADRGVNVLVYDNGSDKPAFIDPNKNNMMVEYDGVANLDKTIEMFVPIAGKDEQGNLQFEVNGELVTIGASAGVDWDMRVTQYGDPRIEWPILELNSEGITRLESNMKRKDYDINFIPAILLDKNLGQLQITPVPTRRSTLSFLIPETDASGQPLLARKIIVVGGPIFGLYEEGSDSIAGNDPIEMEPGQGWNELLPALNENWVYYLGVFNQDHIYGVLNPEYLINYQGLISSSDSRAVCFGEKQNDQDMLSLAVTQTIKAKVK